MVDGIFQYLIMIITLHIAQQDVNGAQFLICRGQIRVEFLLLGQLNVAPNIFFSLGVLLFGKIIVTEGRPGLADT